MSLHTVAMEFYTDDDKRLATRVMLLDEVLALTKTEKDESVYHQMLKTLFFLLEGEACLGFSVELNTELQQHSQYTNAMSLI